MKKDLVIGIVGTAILVLAMIGVFRFEASQEGPSYAVTWPTSDVAGPVLEDRSEEGAATTSPLVLNATNVTRVVFALTWTDDVDGSAPDSFEVSIVSPTGEVRNATGDNGRIEIVFDGVDPQPTDLTLIGTDDADAEARLRASYTGQRGVGTWNVTITIVDAGDQAVPDPTGTGTVPPIAADNGNEWTLTPTLTVYRAQAQRQ